MMCNALSMDSSTGLRTLNSILFPPHHLRSRVSLIRPFLISEIYKAKKKKPNVYGGLSICSSSSLNQMSSYRSERVEVNCLPHGAGEAVNGTSSHNKLLQVVLVSPQIPGNTGCIARTCAASSVGLHLVEPLGYKVDDSKLKRAGLDYWPYVVVKIHGSWSEFRDYFRQQEGEKRLLAFTKRGTSIHSDFSYKRGDWLVFGSETSGLPPEVLLDCKREGCGGAAIRIPMVETYVRCLNLSVSVGIALYEASRQLNYEQLQYTSETETCIDSKLPLITEDIFA
ncbi:tRNA (cytidine(34)-2'-O)-methyltransferase [Thalictrum thalictroides]|uniref:tRNA (Cytidine(34)-2'-O)-methyltransferase n=1 Tax=Thalictrum thalictroides TaxID=46969 RepID=A0A7J6WGD3_THATH|nr:tRNA (cytidine(34)-2'-O)-methyltransferase [Thalictrum thalictroides]